MRPLLATKRKPAIGGHLLADAILLGPLPPNVARAMEIASTPSPRQSNEPVTSCLQTVETHRRRTAPLQGLLDLGTLPRTKVVCRILRIICGHFGRDLARAAFSAAGSIRIGIVLSKRNRHGKSR